MCGIFGMISKKSRPFNKRAFCTMGVRNDSRGGDSCGVFIDGKVDYGVDDKKLFINYFRKANLLDATTECKIALGHCRKASVGKVGIETAQPVVLYNEQGVPDFVLIHNGTIYNYKELAAKYIPKVNIEGLTDSQVMARIFYYAGYDALDEYNGGAVFVIHDYRTDKSLIFKGWSKKYTYSKDQEEERPLYYCWHNGRFVFSSIFETLYSFYYEEIVYTLPHNKLLAIKGDKFKIVKEYPRENVLQTKPVVVHTSYLRDEYGDYGGFYNREENKSFRVKYNGLTYNDDKGELMHGTFRISSYGYVFPNKKTKDTWLQEVSFFQGKMLKCPEAFDLINTKYEATGKKVTPEIEILINMLDFNPYTDDGIQYYWYDGDRQMIPQNEWKWPMADWSCVFDDDGNLIGQGTKAYIGWTTDYNMYTWEKEKIEEAWKVLCEGE